MHYMFVEILFSNNIDNKQKMEEQSFRKRRREQPITIAKHIWPSRGCRVTFRNNKPTREIQAIQKAIEI